MNSAEKKCDIGLIGLAVMCENLVLNMASKGFKVAVYNRTTSRVDNFISGRAAGKSIVGTHSPEALCAALKRPRRVMMMVKAGAAVDKGAVTGGAAGRAEAGGLGAGRAGDVWGGVRNRARISWRRRSPSPASASNAFPSWCSGSTFRASPANRTAA